MEAHRIAAAAGLRCARKRTPWPGAVFWHHALTARSIRRYPGWSLPELLTSVSQPSLLSPLLTRCGPDLPRACWGVAVLQHAGCCACRGISPRPPSGAVVGEAGQAVLPLWLQEQRTEIAQLCICTMFWYFIQPNVGSLMAICNNHKNFIFGTWSSQSDVYW